MVGIFIIEALLALSILVLVHELGHFLVAKKMGVWVEEFGIGLPPRVWGKKVGDTLYSINLLPLGGFVRLHGETSEDGVSDPSRAFINKKPLAKIVIVLAGIVMNAIFGILCFIIIYSLIGIPVVKIESLTETSPAKVAGMLPGDTVKKLGNEKIETREEFQALVDLNKGKEITIAVERDESGELVKKDIQVTPRKDPPADEGPLGVVMTAENVFPPFWQRPFLGAYYGVSLALDMGEQVVMGLGMVGGDLTKGKLSEGVLGPLGLVAFLVYFIRIGLLSLLNLLGLISINLAIFNLLPLPPLDGSRIAIILGEVVTRRKISPKIESFVHALGMALLILLVLAVTAREIPQFIAAGTITKFVENLLQ